MFIPYKVDVPMYRYPWANWALIAATCAISLYFTFGADDETLRSWALGKGEDFHFKNLFTSIMVHAGILHLLGNMLFLFVFGNAINAKLGQVQYLALYVAAGVAAGLTWIMMTSNKVEIVPGLMMEIPVRALGASGAIMGVIGFFLVTYPKNDISIFWTFAFRGGSFEMSAWILIVIYAVLDLWGVMEPHGEVANSAHLGGFVFGAAVATALIYLGWVKSAEGEENLFEAMGWKAKPAAAPIAPAAAKRVRHKYVVHGQDRTSGFTTSFTVDAWTEAEARRLAAQEDLVVQRVEVVG